MKHTPTPWFSEGGNVFASDKIPPTSSNDAKRNAVNAEFIVKAVNCHNDLLEALKATQNILLQNRALGLCQGSEYVYLVKKIEQALAKAEAS